MIVKISGVGKSFKGLSAYLTHDPDADSDKRVAWTHTHNLANDHVSSAVNEMYETARMAELLKQHAGIRAGGRETESPVKHISLNWSPEDNPTREHMISTSEECLRAMQWHEHEAMFVAHDDKSYKHVHIMLNRVHPGTGKCLDESFEKRRAQAWALQYEVEQNRVYCEQRLKNPEEREDAPTRPAWLAFEKNQKKFERDEKSLENQKPILIFDDNKPNFDLTSAEWKILKENQRDERSKFFAEGKLEFKELRNSLYREVRDEFRDRWSDYYEAKRSGGEGVDLATLKAELVAEQKAALEGRRDAACLELKESRKALYEQLLENQQLARHDLHDRQNEGLDSTVFLDLERERHNLPTRKDISADFRAAATEVASAPEDRGVVQNPDGSPGKVWAGRESPGLKSETDIGANIGQGLGFAAVSFLESLVDGFVGAKPAPRIRRPEPDAPEPNPFDEIIDQARARQRNEQEEADREWRKRQRSNGE